MEVANGKLQQKCLRLLKGGPVFIGKSCDDIDANAGIGKHRADGFDAFPVQGRSVPSAHRLQHGVRSALERNVEMGLKFAARGDPINNFGR